MSARLIAVLAALVIAAVAAPPPASARVLKFQAALDGKSGMEPTGSAAVGRARVRIDTVTHRVSVDLDVSGITIDDLWDNLVKAPVGPIHFHKYMVGGDSVLALPLPYGPDYHATARGLRVRMKGYDYDTGAGLVNSTLAFDDFIADLRDGLIVLNVHTDKFHAGEISGRVVAR
jgi:hypothetical protein